ncbi:galactose mutarotase-like domain-containing protein [Leucosporidium creatinivorum]|uniref:Galactose mutarotase-like domain-containing protein n=1 Tax=Leucosporidium creatinivorum TaxID=106004 RepID=A0A1Y2E8S8_9BASI|nr:galactose mutarotase-like domain-containing protein [Leucosporidium creatinivorum]
MAEGIRGRLEAGLPLAFPPWPPYISTSPRLRATAFAAPHPPPLIPIIRTPDDHSRRNKLLVAGGILTILIALWSITGPRDPRNSYAFTHRNGSNIDVFRDWTISSPDGSAQATFIGLGATLTNFWVWDKHGVQRDVVLGYDDRTQYLLDPNYPYFGSIVGRYANRLRNSSFSIPPARSLDKLPPGAQIYHTTPNEHGGRNTLHGGMWGYSRAGWSLVHHGKDTVVFELKDEAGTEGFPATVTTQATYKLRPNAVWTTSLKSTITDGETPLMLSSHVYWNLDGYGAEEEEQGLGVMNHTLKIASSSWIGTDGIMVPTGDIYPISKGSGMDFRAARPIGERIDQTKGKCGTGCTGYDNAFIYDQPHNTHKDVVVELASPASGIKLSILTSQPSLQLYSCSGMNPLYYPRKTSHGGPGKGYGERSCVVLEQQGRIGGVREVQWGEDQIYDDERPYEWWSQYTFSTV